MQMIGQGGPDLEAARFVYQEQCLLTLSTALQRTPMYEGWRSLDPGPRHCIDERYRALPILTKNEIRAAFPSGVVPRGLDLDAALSRGEVSFVRTSGTSDEALENIWNQEWWDASERSSWKLNAIASRVATGRHPEAILGSALSVGPRSDSSPLDRRTRTLGRFLFLNEYGRTEEWPQDHEKRMLAELADFQPAVLEANPSLLARLARYAARTGCPAWQPPLIVFTYEFVSSLHLRDIRKVFHSPLASSYGSTEAGYVFMECEQGFLHQNTDFCRVDLVPISETRGGTAPGGAPEAGPGSAHERAPGPAPRPGGLGKILATTFGNAWFPLVRFEVGDVGRVAAEPCPCGRKLGITLSAIEGRTKSHFVAAERLVTHREMDMALSRIAGLEQYRLDQDTPQDVRCAVVLEPGAGRAAAGNAADALSAILGPGIRISVSVVKALFPEKSGKFLLANRSFALETTHA
jgi:phenylacetate-coenzyme A ligase PaaK-like adenylate-forming protein